MSWLRSQGGRGFSDLRLSACRVDLKGACSDLGSPQVNFGIALACIMVVCGFKTSQDLGNAYGVAVTIDMTVTTHLVAPRTGRIGLPEHAGRAPGGPAAGTNPVHWK